MRLTGAKCQCTVCGLGFGSERAFDRHRIGEFAGTDGINTRRCMTVVEMTAEGWVKDHRGFWLVPDPRRAGGEPQAPRMPPPATHVPESAGVAPICEFAGGDA